MFKSISKVLVGFSPQKTQKAYFNLSVFQKQHMYMLFLRGRNGKWLKYDGKSSISDELESVSHQWIDETLKC